MKLFKKSILVLATLAMAINAHAVGLLGMDQCNSPQTTFPNVASDFNAASSVQVTELENQRRTYDSQIVQVNTDIRTLQGYMGKLFPSPWNEAMQAHMDNGLDCCAPSTVAKNITFNTSRFPASETTTPIEPGPDLSAAQVTAPPPTVTPINMNPGGTSCFGYPSTYCSKDWGTTQAAVPAGAQCLQTSFAATNAWCYGACKNAGEVNPQVCADARVASVPGEYANCMKVLTAYKTAASQKRQLASNISQINVQIQGLKNPNRVSTASTSETTNGGNGLAMLGNILGMVAQIAMPIFNQYRSYQAQSQVGLVSAPPLYRNNNNRMPAGAVPFYGPNYGYGFSNQGNYGRTAPMLQTGGFACSGGLLGSGLSLISNLFGNKSSFGGLGSAFGSNGGGLPSLISGLLGGNNQNSVPPYRMNGFSPPYQPGGIYGARPSTSMPVGAVESNGNNVSNFFTGNGNLTTPSPVPGYVRPAPTVMPIGAFNTSAPSLPMANAPILQTPTGGGTFTLPQNSYLTNGYQSTPYFGNMGNILSTLFGGA